MPASSPPQRQPPKPSLERGGGIGSFVSGGGHVVTLALALVIGLQLGAIPWRFRREVWQLQGALAGGLVGYLVGRAMGRGQRDEST